MARGGRGRRRGSKTEECEEEAPQTKRRKGEEGAAAAASEEAQKEQTEVADPSNLGISDDDDDEDEDEDEEEEVQQEGMEEEEDEDEDEDGPKRIWRPGVDAMEDGEQLDVEPGTYDMLHRAQVEWPCLSFDVVRDDLGAQRSSYPMTAYVVAGTQAEQAADNRIYMMKWSKLYKTNKDGAEDSEDDDQSESDSDDEEHEAILDAKGAPHPGGVNRVRSMPQAGNIVATWADTGKVHMWNLQAQRQALDKTGEQPSGGRPIFTCDAHKQEGFALDFSPHNTGRFLSGGNDGHVFLWEPVAGGWKVGSENPFRGHTAAVEDVQWQRTGGQALFASCGGDFSVRVWDVRQGREKSAIHVAKAHEADVNVLSWSPCVAYLLVTGSDDGSFKIWDTRNTAAGPMANFRWHTKPIVSVDWHPTDETVLAVGSADDSVSLWDMAVEDDAAGREAPPGADHFPAQLLFLHQGQRDPKELRWHPQLPGVCICTAASGFNIFKTCNI